MSTYLYIKRHCPVGQDERRKFELLLATTQCAGFVESLVSLDFPVSEFLIGDDFRLTVPNILGKLPDDTVAFWATEKPGTPDDKERPFMHRHWIISGRNRMVFKPEPIDRKAHAGYLVELCEMLDATHIGQFAGQKTCTLFGPDERIIWTRPDGSGNVCSLDGEVLEAVPAAA